MFLGSHSRSGWARCAAAAFALVVAGCATPTPAAPKPGGPEVFAGTWTEYWPGIDEHATHVVKRVDGAFSIEGFSPLTEQYVISNVRLEGEMLAFDEGTAAHVVKYELRVKDGETLAVKGLGMSGWVDGIVWRRTPPVAAP